MFASRRGLPIPVFIPGEEPCSFPSSNSQARPNLSCNKAASGEHVEAEKMGDGPGLARKKEGSTSDDRAKSGRSRGDSDNRCWRRTATNAATVPVTRTIEAFVDGSCGHGGRRLGAGVFFGEGDPHNRAVPVPKPRDLDNHSCDSLRAELYSSLLCLHLAHFEKHIASDGKLVLHQDSVAAIELLRACRFGARAELDRQCPTRWAAAGAPTGASSSWFSVTMGWGEKIDAQTILRHGDILDRWWWYTRPLRPDQLDLKWVAAHQSQPANRSGDGWRRWRGNDVADTLAKLAARVDRADRDSVSGFADLPLFRADRSIALPPVGPRTIDYLPLRPDPLPSCLTQAIKAENEKSFAIGHHSAQRAAAAPIERTASNCVEESPPSDRIGWPGGHMKPHIMFG